MNILIDFEVLCKYLYDLASFYFSDSIVASLAVSRVNPDISQTSGPRDILQIMFGREQEAITW